MANRIDVTKMPKIILFFLKNGSNRICLKKSSSNKGPRNIIKINWLSEEFQFDKLTVKSLISRSNVLNIGLNKNEKE